MGEEKDDGLGLSLSLNSGSPPTPQNQPSLSLKLNLMHASHDHHQQKKNSWSEMLQSSDRTYLRGVDVNRAPPPTADCDEEVGVSSPNSTISSTICGNKGEREGNNESCEDNEAERASSSRETSNGEEYGGGDTGRKKLRLSKEQSVVLEETFKERNTLNLKQKSALAKQLKLRPRQVEVWFQNRRARTKLKQTEVDCEYLKRCCEKLTEKNRGLQKEVQELRSLKLSPQFYMNMTPPTTLLMCPSCERVSILSSSSSAPVASRGGAALTHHHSAVNPQCRQYPLTPLPHKPLHH